MREKRKRTRAITLAHLLPSTKLTISYCRVQCLITVPPLRPLSPPMHFSAIVYGGAMDPQTFGASDSRKPFCITIYYVTYPAHSPTFLKVQRIQQRVECVKSTGLTCLGQSLVPTKVKAEQC